MTDFASSYRSFRFTQVSALLLTSGLLGFAPIAQAQSVAEFSDRPPSDTLTIAQANSYTSNSYTTVFVNPQTGSDSGNGSEQTPFKTLTHALNVAPLNSIISLAPGLYNSLNGEVFPLTLKSGVTVQGDPSNRGQDVIIQGSGQYLSRTSARQKITVLGVDRAGLRGVTISNPDAQGYGLWIESSSPIVSDSTFTQNGHDGVSIVGNSAPILKNNYFYQNGANGVTIYGTSRPEIRDSIFEKTGFGINIAESAAPRIIGNRITQNKDGIVVQGNASPVLRSNVIDGNERDGLVAIANTKPDLGTQNDQGNNTFLNNAGLDINAQANSQILAVAGNQYGKTSGRLDANAVETIATPIAVQPVISQPVISQPVISQPVISQPPVQPIAAVTPPVQPVMVQSKPPLAVEPAPQVTSPITFSPSTAAVPQELTFTRPDVTPVPSSTRPSINTVIPPVATRQPVIQPTNPTLQAAVPSELVVPIAIQPGSANRGLPVPKPAKMKAVPTSMTFNNLVLPNQQNLAIGSPAPSNLLPVPGSNIPIGNVGDSVTVWRQPGRRSAPPASTALASRPAGVKHRVVVEMADAERLKSIIPGAFAVFSSGRQMMQAGAFGDAQKANELLQKLTSQGIRATAETF